MPSGRSTFFPMSGQGPIFKDDPWATPQPPLADPAGAQALSPPDAAVQGLLPVSYSVPPVVATEIGANRLPLALLAGAGVALVGGLVWAGVVIATHIDFGLLAWFVGAATGIAIVRVAGGYVTPGARVAAGLLAAGGVVVGKYVIFVHAVRKQLGMLLAAQGRPVHYLDTRQMGIFIHHVGSIVRPIYILWIALAFVAALRTASGRATLGRRR
jgi:hypothetical protein